MTDAEIETYWNRIWTLAKARKDVAKFHYIPEESLVYIGMFKDCNSIEKPYRAFELERQFFRAGGRDVSYLSKYGHVITTDRELFDRCTLPANPLIQLAQLAV